MSLSWVTVWCLPCPPVPISGTRIPHKSTSKTLNAAARRSPRPSSPGRLLAGLALLHDGVQGAQDGLQVPLRFDLSHLLLRTKRARAHGDRTRHECKHAEPLPALRSGLGSGPVPEQTFHRFRPQPHVEGTKGEREDISTEPAGASPARSPERPPQGHPDARGHPGVWEHGSLTPPFQRPWRESCPCAPSRTQLR